MRFLTAALVLPLLTVQAHAQTSAVPHAAPAAITLVSATTPPTAAPPAPAPKEHVAKRRTHRHYMSWKQRFATANTTHDGHLTLAQAKEGYYAVAHHFREIDTGKKGYVTLADIAAWHKAERAKRHERHARNDRSPHRDTASK